MDKPVAALMREWIESQDFYEICQSYRHARDPSGREGQPSASEAFETLKREIMAHLTASIPDGAVPVVWPKELTRRRLLDISHGLKADGHVHYAQVMDALAAIAPERKKRVVNLWAYAPEDCLHPKPTDWAPRDHYMWRCVARNVELEG